MLNEILHSFFFWMPAIVAVAVGRDMKSPLARAILVWGGLAFVLVIGAAVLGMLMCDGRSLTVYSNCAGGAAVTSLFAGARPVFVGAYPITPASDVLHELARFRHFGVKTFQAEDEIAAASSAIGASFVGHLGITATSGPGFVLKQEALNLAVIDIQRGGPSTGLPTKTEQADLLLSLYGRNSDSPIPVIAASTPGDCFYTVLEAFRLATRYMTPVVSLSDRHLAASSEPSMLKPSTRLA